MFSVGPFERDGNSWIGTNKCIYCGCVPMEPDALDTEHIAPLGLSGSLSIKNSSFKDCGAITGRFEGKCLQDFMLPLRLQEETRTRRRGKGKKRPSGLEMGICSTHSHAINMHLINTL
jgi:hypothetical protein